MRRPRLLRLPWYRYKLRTLRTWLEVLPLARKYRKLLHKEFADKVDGARSGWGVGAGWYTFLYPIMLAIRAAEGRYHCYLRVNQVKEKHGTLRLYHTTVPNKGATDEQVEWFGKSIDRLVAIADGMSGITCEVCGRPGMFRTKGWCNTMCNNHYDRWQKGVLR